MAMGTAVETVPTIGLNVKMVKRGGVNMKCWDIGGQKQYSECCTAVAPWRAVQSPLGVHTGSEWGRYTRGCSCIIFVVDTHAVRCYSARRANTAGSHTGELQRDQIPQARKELHRLLEDRYDMHTRVSCFLVDVRPHAAVRLCGCDPACRRRELATTPLLVCANKIDLTPHIPENELIRGASVKPRRRAELSLLTACARQN